MTRERILLLAFVGAVILADIFVSPLTQPATVHVADVAPSPPATIIVPEPSTTASPLATTAPTTTASVTVPSSVTSIGRNGSAVDHPPVPASTPPVEAHVAGGSGTFIATCYTLTGTTASGRPAGSGGVAVDPSLIPMGSAVHVDGLGTYTADDTGGDIKGYRLDIWMSSYSACQQFGRRSVHAEW